MTALACPSRRELAAYNLGYLPAEVVDELTRHFEQCRDCLSLLDGLDPGNDRLLELLSAKDPLPLPQPNELAALLGRAADIPRSTLPHTLTHWESPPAPFRELPSGEQPVELGQYSILGELGRGGMGTVFKALHVRLEKLVALKILSPERLQDPHALIRFEREMKAIGKLRHPRIVAAHDAGEANGQHFLVMELIDGIDLATLIRRRGPLAIADACELARQAAEGLQAIEEHRLVHRDIKPSNLMLTVDGELKILDLGLALLQSPDSVRRSSLNGSEADGAALSHAPAAHVLGTADYLAPEQARDSRSVDMRADLYSLGCTLVKLLTGEPPYPAPQWRSIEQKIAAHREAPLVDVRQRRPDVPVDLARVVQRLLAKNPHDRFQTAAEAAAALQRFTRGASLKVVVDLLRESSADPRVQPAPMPSRNWFARWRRHPLGERIDRIRWLIPLAALAGLLSIAAYLLTGEGDLTLHVHEPGIRITIDGRDVPSAVQFLPQRVEHQLRVPAGRHELLLSKPGFRPFATSVWLLRDRQTLLDVTLVREPVPAGSPAVAQANSGPLIATEDPDGAWELSIRPKAGQRNDVLYRPLKADWAGAERVGLVEDAIFFGPFGAEQPDSIWIFRTQVEAAAAATVEIFFGHDDGGAMYLNGELVNSSPTTAGRFGHLAFVGPLHFRAGVNTLEIAVYVAEGASSINLGALSPQHRHALSQVSGLSLHALPPTHRANP